MIKIYFRNINEKRHRLKGPAYINNNDLIYFKNGKYHRDNNKPAIIKPSGFEQYCVNDKLHRTDGPALIDANGYTYYFLNDIQYTEKDYYEKLKEINNELKNSI